jgi:hypothetical protein
MSAYELTRTLWGLFSVGQDSRDDEWRRRFYAAVPEAALIVDEPQVEFGPDEFQYFRLAVPEPGLLRPCSVSDVLDHCLNNGLGITLFDNPRFAGPPAWVFRYGDLLSFKLYGSFDHDPAEPPLVGGWQSHEVKEFLIAAPSETYLPSCARKAIGDFFRNTLRHPDPRVALVIDPEHAPPRYLMFNLSGDDYDGDSEKLQAAFQYLSWFLPGNYTVAAMPTGWRDNNFKPLA